MSDLEQQSQSDRPADMARRAVLRGGAVAWTVPVVLAATSAPALATSPGGALLATKGGTAAVPNGDGYYDVLTSGTTIKPSAAVAANTLTLTVTYQPVGNPDNEKLIYKYATNPPGWAGPSPGAAVPSDSPLLYTYTGSVGPGATLAFPDGRFFGTFILSGTQEGEGVFTLTFAAPSQTSGSFTVSTPGYVSPRPGGASVLPSSAVSRSLSI